MQSLQAFTANVRKSAAIPPDILNIITTALVAAIGALLQKCGGNAVKDRPSARGWLQAHADDFYSGDVPHPPIGFAATCRDHGLKGNQNQKRFWVAYLHTAFADPDNAAAMISTPNLTGNFGEDASAVPPEPAPTNSVKSPPPPPSMGGDPAFHPDRRPQRLDESDAEPMDEQEGTEALPGEASSSVSDEDADAMAAEEARRDDEETADGSSSSSSGLHPADESGEGSSSVAPFNPRPNHPIKPRGK